MLEECLRGRCPAVLEPLEGGDGGIDDVWLLLRDRALHLAERSRRAKGLDPILAIYAAYAYHDLHREGLLAEMKRYLQQDVGILPYDIALLSSDLRGRLGAATASTPRSRSWPRAGPLCALWAAACRPGLKPSSGT